MASCFVIQPFDGAKYDKRFRDIYKPAIEAASLEAYRVDQDSGVLVPIDAIEKGIRQASVCLAGVVLIKDGQIVELVRAVVTDATDSGDPLRALLDTSERASAR
jgi:hypothetical protein